VPKATGEPVWLPPYITENLDERVISYNIPIYYEGQFVGVIGIELDYSFIAEQVDNLTLYENGYAYVSDEDGYIVYHPHMDVPAMETRPEIPEGFVSEDTIIRYNYDGMEKMAAWLPLINHDHLNVSVPVKEINADWHGWINTIIIAFLLLLAAFILFFMRYTRRITKPLQDLTKVAEQIDEGNYDHNLEYKGNDEIGVLTRTFSRVTANLKKHVTDLNDLAYADALTSLHNKGAFDICVNNMQTQLDEPGGRLEFAVCIFDCNRLKQVNDQNGHDKGDIYLKETAEIICEVYEHSPVFRIGGDEFAALLLDSDYKNRDDLLQLFDERCSAKRNRETDAWEKVDVARGMAVYDPQEDESVKDVVRRADKIMYEDKWRSKHSG
jgi:diguanylate cyclase (GGDEF)-like protein